jgi:hypothetical protein
MRPLLCLLALCAPLAACTSSLDEQDVREFIDIADDAMRKRFAPDICSLRGQEFRINTKFHAAGMRGEPGRMSIDRHMYCVEAGKFARIRQYKLERKALEIDVAADRQTARVKVHYVETEPFYGDSMPRTPDDFYQFQILDVHEDSVVGMESGDLVYLSTDSEAHQSLIGKDQVNLPYD